MLRDPQPSETGKDGALEKMKIALSSARLPAMGAAADELVGEIAHQRPGLAFGLSRLDLGDSLLPRLVGGQFRGLADNDVGRPELADDADEIRPRIVGGNVEAEGGQRMVQHGQRTLAVLLFPETSAAVRSLTVA